MIVIGGRGEHTQGERFFRMQGMLISVDFVVRRSGLPHFLWSPRPLSLSLGGECWPVSHRTTDVTHNVIKDRPLLFPFATLRFDQNDFFLVHDMRQIPEVGGELARDAYADLIKVDAAHLELEPALVQSVLRMPRYGADFAAESFLPFG